MSRVYDKKIGSFMSALELRAYGGVENLVFNDSTEVALPEKDEVQVRILAAGVNVIDTKIRQGTSFAAKTRGERFPWTIGFDMSGEVVKVPKDCEDFQEGDLVCGLVGFPLNGGAYSSVNNFQASELIKIPEGCGIKVAGALPLAGLTAYQALFDIGHLQPEQTVIISAAAGGVGHIAVQLAKNAGARVLGICSKENHKFVKGLGADAVAEYDNEECLKWQSEADLFIDLVGGQSAINNLSLLKLNATMVSVPTITYQAVRLAATDMSINVAGMVVKHNKLQLKKMLDMIADGELKVHISESFFLKDGAKAHAVIGCGHTVGKVILLPNGIVREVKT